MADKEVKLYKNPERNKQKAYKPYIPNYQLLGAEPTKYPGGSVVVNGVVAPKPEPLPLDNPRAKRPLFRPEPDPQATVVIPASFGHAPLPNIGNNAEQVWSSIDGKIIDDVSSNIEDNQIIDNNDFVTDQAFGFRNGPTAQDLPQDQFKPQQFTIETQEQKTSLIQIINDLDYDNYLLIVSGEPICSGPQEEIEEQARLFAFGEHETCDNVPVPLEEILVIKKAKIRVGLFVEK
jgi:hypothetical protein